MGCLLLKEGDAAPAQANGHFLANLFECKLIRGWQEVRDDLDRANGLSRVFCFPAHKLPFLFASSLRQ